MKAVQRLEFGIVKTFPMNLVTLSCKRDHDGRAMKASGHVPQGDSDFKFVLGNHEV